MDKYWIEIKNLFQTNGVTGPIIAPLGFDWDIESYFPYHEAGIVAEPHHFVLHKGMIGSYISEETVSNLISRLHLHYANPVFIVFSRHPSAVDFDHENAKLPSLEGSSTTSKSNKTDQMLYAAAAIEMEKTKESDNNVATEFLWNLFLSGEFDIVYEEAKTFEDDPLKAEIALEFYFRSRNYRSVLSLSNRLLSSSPTLQNRIYRAWAEVSLGLDITDLEGLRNDILCMPVKGDTDTVRSIELGLIAEDVWDAVTSNPKLEAYLRSRYYPYNYIDLDNLEYSPKPNPGKEIDAVISWFDPTDKEWAAQRRFESARYTMNEEYDGKNRLYQSGEVYVAIELLCKHIQNLRNIFIVSPNKIDRFSLSSLSHLAYGKIKFIDQDSILDEDIKLPCYNSDVIESQIYKIPGLSDDFIYLNDDYFLLSNNAVPNAIQSDTFYADRRLWKRSELLKTTGQGSRDAVTAALFHKRLGYIPSFMPAHQVYICKKSAFERTNDFFSKDFDACLYPFQFRQDNSVRYLSLMFWYSSEVRLQSPIVLPEENQKVFVGLSEEQLEIIYSSPCKFASINNLNSDNSDVFEKFRARATKVVY